MIKTKHLTWAQLTNLSPPKQARNWLTDECSLTKKLKGKFENFSVEICFQGIQSPHKNEALLLNKNTSHTVREVLLLGDGIPVVFARSIIPLTPDTKALLNIGTKPLGEVLFEDKSIKRSALQITHTGEVWGRRSIFNIKHSKVLVSEFFLESIYA
jgi:chorismate--pyruvate lyase